MVLVVKINTAKRKGAEAVRLFKGLNASEEVIRFESSKGKKGKLTDELIARPGPRVGKKDFENWLNEPDGKSFSLEEARDRTRKYLNGLK
jgi:hypothetical protein